MSTIRFTVANLPNTVNTFTDQVSLQDVINVAGLKTAIKEKIQPALNDYAAFQLMLKVKRYNESDDQAQDLTDPRQAITDVLQWFGNDFEVLVFLPPIANASLWNFGNIGPSKDISNSADPKLLSMDPLAIFRDSRLRIKLLYEMILEGSRDSPSGLPIIKTAIGDIKAIRLLGSGSDSIIFEALTENVGRVVIKFSLTPDPLGREAETLKKLNEVDYIPRLLHERLNTVPSCIVTSMVGRKITKVDVPTAFGIIIDVLEVLKGLHNYGYIHNDIHPGNIVNIGGKFRLIDFGLAVQRSDKRDTIPTNWPEGNMTFASHNRGKYLGPGDDLEALCYTIAFMYDWDKKYWHADAQDPFKAVHQKEEKLFYLFDGLPQVFQDFFDHVYDLDITATPVYEYWQQQFRQTSPNSYSLPKKQLHEPPPRSPSDESERRIQPRTDPAGLLISG